MNARHRRGVARAPFAPPLAALSLAALALTLAVAPPRDALAQPSKAPDTGGRTLARPYGEDELVRLALANNPRLRAERTSKQVAEGQVRSAYLWDNPTVRLEWLHVQAAPVDQGYGVGLSWTPPQPFELSARKGAARAHVTEVQEELRELAADLEASVRAGCAAAEALGEQLTAAERGIANRRLLLDAVRERLRRGASTRIELGLVQISIARAEQERDDIAVRRGGLLREIAAAAALPSDTAFELDTAKRPSVAAADEAPPPSLPKVREQALKQRPLLRADAARAENRAETVRAESSRAWPWFSLAAIPRYRLRGDASQFQSDISFAIDISVPIFEGNGGRVASAEAERRRQEGLHAANVAAVRRDVDTAGAEAARRKDMLDRYRATLEPLLQEHTATLQEALQARQLDVVTMLASEDLVSRVQRERAEAKLAYRNALLRLQRASGGLAAGR